MIKHYKNKTHRYARIHAFYAEGNNLNEEHMSDVIMNDGRFMQRKLKESQLAIDYFFVMLYFDFKDKLKGSVLLNNNVLETNKM